MNQETKGRASARERFSRGFSLPAGASLLYDVRHSGFGSSTPAKSSFASTGRKRKTGSSPTASAADNYQCSNLRYRTVEGQARAFDIVTNANVAAWCRAAEHL